MLYFTLLSPSRPSIHRLLNRFFSSEYFLKKTTLFFCHFSKLIFSNFARFCASLVRV